MTVLEARTPPERTGAPVRALRRAASGQPAGGRQKGNRNQRQAVEHDLPRRHRPFRVQERQHLKTGPLVIFLMKPGDRQKMGKLPQEDNPEKEPGFHP